MQSKTVPKNKKQSHDFTSLSNDIPEEFRNIPFEPKFHNFNNFEILGASINDVSSEGEGGGPPSKPIYYISLFSNLS